MEVKMGYLALDIGGTKVEACRISDNFDIKLLGRLITSKFSTGRLEFFNEIIALINSFIDQSDSAVCISFNCIVEGNIVLASSLLGGENIDLSKIMSEHFSLPCVLENDVICQATAEAKLGYGLHCRDFVLVNIGTGLRAVSVSDGKIFSGSKNAAGEIEDLFSANVNGHTIERCLSGRGIVEIYQALNGKIISTGEIFRSANVDQAAQESIKIFQEKLVELLVLLSKFYNPQLIILTGSVGRACNKFLPVLAARYSLKCPSYLRFENILVSRIDYAACLGAVFAYLDKTPLS